MAARKRLPPVPVDCIAYRHGDLTSPLIPPVKGGSGRRIYIAAMTPSFLVNRTSPNTLSPVAKRLIEHLTAGGSVRLLLTNTLALGLWEPEKPSIGGHADQRRSQIDLFLAVALTKEVRHRVEVHTHDWVASMALTTWDGRDGEVWIAPYTFDPRAASGSKMQIRFAAASEPGVEYRRQFDAMWVRSEDFDATPSIDEVKQIELRARKLVTVAAKRAGRHADLAVVIALSEELDTFRQSCEAMVAATGGGALQWNQIRGGCFETSLPTCLPNGAQIPRRVLIALVGGMGRMEASAVTQALLDRERAGLVVSLGIAGKLSDDVALGDVVVPSEVRDYLHRSKAIDRPIASATGLEPAEASAAPTALASPRTTEELLLGGAAWPTSALAVQAARDLAFGQRGAFEAWQGAAVERLSTLGAFAPPDRPPMVHADDAHTASGDLVVASLAMQARIRNADRNVLAVEMEAAGVVARATRRPVPVACLVVRGISDRADPHKSAVDKASGGDIRKVAMANASSFLLTLVQTGALFKEEV